MPLQLDEQPRTLRQINCDARRDRILDAARELLATGGVQAVTMRRIATTADLSVTTLYNLIGGRDEILDALVTDAIDRMDEILDREAPLEDPLQRCRAVVTVSVASVVEEEAIFRPLATAIASDTLRSTSGEHRGPNRGARMQSLAIRAAIGQGLLSDLLDPDALGAQIYHGWEAAFHQWGQGHLDESSFRARALYGLYVALLGVASDRVRPQIESELRSLESELVAANHPEDRDLKEHA